MCQILQGVRASPPSPLLFPVSSTAISQQYQNGGNFSLLQNTLIRYINTKYTGGLHSRSIMNRKSFFENAHWNWNELKIC